MADQRLKVMRPRLHHPDIAFHVDVTLTKKDGRWLALAMLADEPNRDEAMRWRRRHYPEAGFGPIALSPEDHGHATHGPSRSGRASHQRTAEAVAPCKLSLASFRARIA